jgi:hypothetical protein
VFGNSCCQCFSIALYTNHQKSLRLFAKAFIHLSRQSFNLGLNLLMGEDAVCHFDENIAEKNRVACKQV